MEEGLRAGELSLYPSRLGKPTESRFQMRFKKADHVLYESLTLAGFGSRDSRYVFPQTQLLGIGELIDSGDWFTGV
jgi:hypothetical protein